MHYNGLFIQRGPVLYKHMVIYKSFCPADFYCSRTSNKFRYSKSINQAWHATVLNSPGLDMCIFMWHRSFYPCIINQPLNASVQRQKTHSRSKRFPLGIITDFSVLTASSLLMSCHLIVINLTIHVSPHSVFFFVHVIRNGLELLYVYKANELRRKIYWQP